MLTITSPRVARALAAGRRRSRRRAAWGSFSQRTIDRRYCGVLAADAATMLNKLSKHRYASQYPGGWYCAAVRLAGGLPSSHGCWQPFGAATQAQPAAICHFCQSAIEEVSSRCACFAHV